MSEGVEGKLAAYVFAGNRWFGPGDDVPADVAAEITNPKAWVGGKVPDLGSEDTGGTVPDGEPSESWKNAQLKAYAAEHGIDLGDASTKAEYLAAIVAATSGD